MKQFLLILALATVTHAQKIDPVQWVLRAKSSVAPGQQTVVELTAKVQPGYHLYSLTTPAGGAIPTTVKFGESTLIAHVEVFQPKPERKFDANFGVDTETFEGTIPLLAKVTLGANASAGEIPLTVSVRYQVCTEKTCIRPTTKQVATTLRVDPGAPASVSVIPPAYISGNPELTKAGPGSGPKQSANETQGLGAFILVAFGFGLAAIFTPCVFPMIPFTMSFFMSQGERSRRDTIAQATVFCLGIVLLFTLLGLGATAVAGPFGAVKLGGSVWVNGFIAALFFLFGLSLLGAFEITLPSSLLTKLNTASGRGGYMGALVMGLAFSLTSFACVGPFMGTLLAASVQGGSWQPTVGMIGFAAGLATPFFGLALFPSALARLPRSGHWMLRVKVVMGFVVIAASLKYLSNVDQVLQLGILTRDRFLALWFVFFLLPGLYLLGFLRLEGVKRDEDLGLGRMLVASLLVAFAVTLLPGVFGGRLGELEAILPPPTAESGVFAASQLSKQKWLKDDYRAALQLAKQEQKLVLVNFTGHACTNCHWMKANMFSRATVDEALSGLVLVDLFTDGTDAASEFNQKLQDEKFRSVALPYYAILTPDGQIIAQFEGLTRNESEFISFLRTRTGA